MNPYRNKGIFWGLTGLISIFVMTLGFRMIHNKTAVSIFSVYSRIVVDIVFFGLILPCISGLIIREVNGWMVSSRLLAFNSRLIWWKELKKKQLKNCFLFTVVMILPVFILANLFMGIIKIPREWVYMLFLFLTYFIYFYLLAVCMLVMEIKFHRTLLTVSFVLAVSFFPNMLTFLFPQLGLPTVSGFLNLSYALDEGSFCWGKCGKVCVMLLILVMILEKTGRAFIKKQDIYWK